MARPLSRPSSPTTTDGHSDTHRDGVPIGTFRLTRQTQTVALESGEEGDVARVYPLSGWQRAAIVVASAALYALAFPPWEIRLTPWVALVPFLLATRPLRPGRAAWFGLLWGTAAIWIVAFWVPPAIIFYYQQPWWFGLIFCVVGSLILWGSQYAVFAASAAWIGQRCRGYPRVLLLATLWVACEFMRARLLIGEPWMLLGYGLLPYPTLIQPADLGGVYLLSFPAVLVGAALAEAISFAAVRRDEWLARPNASLSASQQHSERRPWLRGLGVGVLRFVAPAFLVVLAAHVYGAARLRAPLPDEPSIPVMIVQGNNDLGAQWQPEFYGEGLDRYLRLTSEAAARVTPDVIVWPESAVTFFLAHEPNYRALISRMLEPLGADLIVGGPHYEDLDPAVPRYFNSAFYITSDGEIASRYDKVRLLPFAEYFPLRTIGFLRRKFDRVRSFTAGGGGALLETRMGKAAVVICFEAVFPELALRQMRRGAEVLLNLSNDVWLGQGAGPEQHLAMARLRAVENRTWLIRATTTGISAFVDPLGRIRARSGSFTAETIHENITPMRVETLYEQVGDLFAATCLAVSIAGALILGFRRHSSM